MFGNFLESPKTITKYDDYLDDKQLASLIRKYLDNRRIEIKPDSIVIKSETDKLPTVGFSVLLSRSEIENKKSENNTTQMVFLYPCIITKLQEFVKKEGIKETVNKFKQENSNRLKIGGPVLIGGNHWITIIFDLHDLQNLNSNKNQIILMDSLPELKQNENYLDFIFFNSFCCNKFHDGCLQKIEVEEQIGGFECGDCSVFNLITWMFTDKIEKYFSPALREKHGNWGWLTYFKKSIQLAFNYMKEGIEVDIFSGFKSEQLSISEEAFNKKYESLDPNTASDKDTFLNLLILLYNAHKFLTTEQKQKVFLNKYAKILRINQTRPFAALEPNDLKLLYNITLNALFEKLKQYTFMKEVNKNSFLLQIDTIDKIAPSFNSFEDIKEWLVNYGYDIGDSNSDDLLTQAYEALQNKAEKIMPNPDQNSSIHKWLLIALILYKQYICDSSEENEEAGEKIPISLIEAIYELQDLSELQLKFFVEHRLPYTEITDEFFIQSAELIQAAEKAKLFKIGWHTLVNSKQRPENLDLAIPCFIEKVAERLNKLTRKLTPDSYKVASKCVLLHGLDLQETKIFLSCVLSLESKLRNKSSNHSFKFFDKSSKSSINLQIENLLDTSSANSAAFWENFKKIIINSEVKDQCEFMIQEIEKKLQEINSSKQCVLSSL